jgi:ATP-binding protein involved in chromosome partitioning
VGEDARVGRPPPPGAYDEDMAAASVLPPTVEQVTAALAKVNDPEIHRPITDLGMVKNVEVSPDGKVLVEVYLTVSGCPLRDTITRDVTGAVSPLPGVAGVRVDLDVMSEEQRRELQTKLRGGRPEPVIPFSQPASLTRVFAIASGKGGVGKSSVTVNLAAALAAAGQKVGVVDADIYGHSIPRMLGVTGHPTQVEQMIMPPSAHDVRVISIGMFTAGNTPVVWRGPMLHRALQQFLADVYWGDLDVLLLDLPPGTGDIAISVAQLLPGAELLVVTTPQVASSEVAERAGAIAVQTHQRITGVIENMSGFACPHCGETVDVFGSGGGQEVAEALTRITGVSVPVLGQIPVDTRLREGGDKGVPLVLSDPGSPASKQLIAVADTLASRTRSLAGRQLGLSPV